VRRGKTSGGSSRRRCVEINGNLKMASCKDHPSVEHILLLLQFYEGRCTSPSGPTRV
jgi:hypothetical protein